MFWLLKSLTAASRIPFIKVLLLGVLYDFANS